MAHLPARALLHQLMSYDRRNGRLIWKHRPREMFGNERACAVWNSRFAGEPAGYETPAGHRSIRLAPNLHREHRLIWLHVRGEPVPQFIDHVDHDKTNNRIGNLRAATKSQNNWNADKPRNNRSGVKGVILWEGRFLARIKVHGRSIHIGSFDTLEQAAAARWQAARRLHGQFARK